MRHDDIRSVLDEEARALVPDPPDLWPRIAAAVRGERPRRRSRIGRWLGGLAALLLAAAAAAAALVHPLGGAAQEERVPAAARPVLVGAVAASVATPTPTPPTSSQQAQGAVATATPLPFWEITPAPVVLPASGVRLPTGPLPSPAVPHARP